MLFLKKLVFFLVLQRPENFWIKFQQICPHIFAKMRPHDHILVFEDKFIFSMPSAMCFLELESLSCTLPS